MNRLQVCFKIVSKHFNFCLEMIVKTCRRINLTTIFVNSPPDVRDDDWQLPGHVAVRLTGLGLRRVRSVAQCAECRDRQTTRVVTDAQLAQARHADQAIGVERIAEFLVRQTRPRLRQVPHRSRDERVVHVLYIHRHKNIKAAHTRLPSVGFRS